VTGRFSDTASLDDVRSPRDRQQDRLSIPFAMNPSEPINRQLLPEFTFTPTEYGWNGRFPDGPHRFFETEISVQIDTRAVPDEPKVLPPVSADQAALIRTITPALSSILREVEEAMLDFNEEAPDFRRFIRNPHVWLDTEEDDGESWAFVIERTDNPDFGYHAEFKGTRLVEVWAGD